MRASLTVRITPDDVGRRVSVRSRTHADPPLTDTVGYLRSWTGGELQIERKDGSTAHIAATDLVAAKVLPHPPPTRSGR